MTGPAGHRPPPSALGTGLACRCPRCGVGKLYDGLLAITQTCSSCGLALGDRDSGDGPAVFVILILGAIVTAGALWVETAHTPPIWVHMVVWPPVIVVLAILMLRPMKAILVAQHYRHRSEHDAGDG